MSENTFQDLLDERRQFEPSDEFQQQAVVTDNTLYARASDDIVGYWEDRAHELDWFKLWDQAMVWEPPHCQWFVGGKLNMSHLCLDQHLDTSRRHKAALIWEGENGDQRTLTYLQLHREVCKFANVLRSLGVEKGDRVAVYLPMVVEAAICMQACARIGAIHSVVFGGFSPDSLADRINDSACKVLVTADGGLRRGQVLALKSEADKALTHTPSIENVVVVKRTGSDCPMTEGRDHWYQSLMEGASPECAPVVMDAEDVLFILYTSGTTGQPKGVVHTTGGYAVGVHASCKDVFDLRDTDVYWCTADVGWVTGHSYVVYGPLICGATVFMYEGAPNHPETDRFWSLIAEHRVSIFYTAPTAIRAFMKWGDEQPAKHDLTSLRLLGSVGEPINPEAWTWYHAHIGGGLCPIVDTWWQTETGSMMISGLPGISTMRPGYAGLPLPGVAATILGEDGVEVKTGAGILAITHPWPSMLRTIWGDDARFVDTYFSKWDARTYFPGDGAKRGDDGYMMILGRIDDVLNVSGHRIGTMEVESALVDHPAVAEAAVVGRAHPLKGQVIVAFVSLRIPSEEDFSTVLREHVAHKIGGIAKPEQVIVSQELPKTRSGKIMRRLLRDLAEGRPLGDTTTLADPSVVERLREQLNQR